MRMPVSRRLTSWEGCFAMRPWAWWRNTAACDPVRFYSLPVCYSPKIVAAVYGIEINSINYHIKKIFADAELDDKAVIRKIRITGSDGKSYNVNHYNLQVIIALGFKIDNEKAVAFRKWANQIVSEYTIKGWVMDVPRLKDGSPIKCSRDPIGGVESGGAAGLRWTA